MKILVIGHARHGKDTVAEMMRVIHSLAFTSSSMFCAGKVMIPAFLGKRRVSYGSAEQCYEDRVNHRAFWFDEIRAYTAGDPCRLTREIFERNDVYCGMRSRREFFAAKNAGLFDFCVWVDRSEVAPPEGKSSMQLEEWMADFVLDNNGSLEDLRRRLGELMTTLHIRHNY